MQLVVSKNPEKLDKWFTEIKNKKFFLILLIFFIIGMFCGALSVKTVNSEYGLYINKTFENFYNFRATAGFLNLFFDLFLTSIATVVLISVLSFGISGLLALPLISFFKGVGCCVISGLLYRNYSLEGIAFADLILLPFNLAGSFVVIYLSAYGFELSLNFFYALKSVSVTGCEIRPKCLGFLKRAVWCILFCVIISLLETVFTVCFIKYFSFF